MESGEECQKQEDSRESSFLFFHINWKPMIFFEMSIYV